MYLLLDILVLLVPVVPERVHHVQHGIYSSQQLEVLLVVAGAAPIDTTAAVHSTTSSSKGVLRVQLRTTVF